MASLPPPPPHTSISNNGKVKSQAFEDAYRRFFESLSPKEQLLCSPCASHDDFIDAMRKLEEVAKKRRKRGSSRFLDRIAKLSDRLQPFFEVVNIMIQSNPEYTALVWGSLRFILQLASGFNTFFDKLITTLERFCREMPQYEDIQLLQKDQISARIKACTEKVYGHMFQFFREVANVFTSGGRIKRTPVFIAEILWRPFENRFENLLREVQSCRSLIEFDLLLAQAQVANDTKAIVSAQKEIAEKEQEEMRNAQKKADELAAMTDDVARMISRSHREQLFERIQKWLCSPQYSDALVSGRALRELGTNQWIFTDPRFCEWREREWAIRLSEQPKKFGSNILWIKGNPGTGKSVLASSIIDELMEAYRQDSQSWELCYFFFTPDCKDSTTRISAYRSILAQILHRSRQDDETINKFDFIMTEPSFSGTPKAGLDELFGLLKLMFQKFQILLILDGIDECENDSLLIEEDIMELSKFTTAKIILCGRNNTASLIRTVPTSSQICLDRDIVGTDIRLFISTQVDLLLEDKLLPPGSNSEELVNRLSRGADGMFLWAKLMFKYLELPIHDAHSRMKVIWSVLSPEGLEKMYARIVHAIFQEGETWRDFASRILVWASYSLRPLTLKELYDHMTFDTSNTANVDSDQLNAFQERVCIAGRGLVEFSGVPGQPTAQRILRYIHLSVKEHFSQRLLGLEARDPLVSSEAIEHLACAGKCLGYLLYHFSTRQGQLGRPVFTDPQLGAFSDYAASQWMDHLNRSFTSPSFYVSDISSALMRVASSLSSFLKDSEKVKFWIQVLYKYSSPYAPSDISSSLGKLAFTLRNSHCFPAGMEDLSATMQQFCEDLPKALNAWDKHLRSSTDILWDEMVVFSESPFMAGPRKGQAISMAPGPPPGSVHPKFSLISKVSHTDLHGETTAVVSTWQTSPPSLTTSTVKYELWKHDTVPTKLSEIINPMKHQLAMDVHPISISDDLRSFTVMDRLFVVVPNGNEAPVSIRSIKIPVLYKNGAPSGATFFKISSQGRFLFSSEHPVNYDWDGNEEDHMKATVFEIENNRQLLIKPILRRTFRSEGCYNISEAVFHSAYPVVIVRGEKSIAAWNFAKRGRNESENSFWKVDYFCGEDVKEMAISSCGKFIVLRDDQTNQPTIFSIPEWLFAQGPSGFNELIPSPRSDLKQNKSTAGSLVKADTEGSALQLSPGCPVNPNQILTSANGTRAQLITVQGGEEITIARTEIQSGRTEEFINIIRVPQGQGIGEFVPTILAPAPEDESIKMILNKRGREGLQQSHELPMFLSRDISAVKHTFYDGAGRYVNGPMAAARLQIRNSEDSVRDKSDKEPAMKKRKTDD